jgi:hypothetical protein
MCGTGLGTGAYKGDRIAECQNAGTSSETQDRWGSKVQAIKNIIVSDIHNVAEIILQRIQIHLHTHT